MINSKNFNSFDEYENYINKLSHFWTMMYKLFPEIKNIEHPGTFDCAMTKIVNDMKTLEQHIRMLENMLEHNTKENRNKYVAIVNKFSNMSEDFI